MDFLPTIFLVLAAISIGIMTITVLVAFRASREARSAIFSLVREEATLRAKRAWVSMFVWLAITALILGGWLASLSFVKLNTPQEEVAMAPTEEVRSAAAIELPPPSLTPTESPTMTPTSSKIVATVPPSATSSPIPLSPTDTPIPTTAIPSPTVTPPPPTATSTPTPLPPTATATSSPTSTATPSPTATMTPIPPTATTTPIPPTATPEPTKTPISPTNTATSQPETETPIARDSALEVASLSASEPEAQMGPIQFTTDITTNVEAVDPSDTFSGEVKAVYAVFPYSGIADGTPFKAVWYQEETEVWRDESIWNWGTEGRFFSYLTPKKMGTYKLELHLEDHLLATGLFEIQGRNP